MEPTENNQNNNSGKIRINPTLGGGTSSWQKPDGKSIFNSNVTTPKVEEKIVPTPNSISSSVIPAPVFTSVNSGGIQSENTNLDPREYPRMTYGEQGQAGNDIKPQSEKKISISPIHTFADDLKNTLQKDDVSMAKIAMAEAKKQEAEKVEEEEVSPTSTKNTSIIIISILIILIACVGVAGALYYLSVNSQKNIPVTNVRIQSIIPYDENTIITLDSNERKSLVDGVDSAKKQKYQKETTVVFLPIFEKNGTSTSMLKTEKFFSILETRIPPALSRTFGENFMAGLNGKVDKNNFFILLSSDSFSQMYAGMLEWEPAMADDIGELFFTKEDLVDPIVPIVSTSSASTTANVATTTQQTLIPRNLGGQASSTALATTSLITASTSTLQTFDKQNLGGQASTVPEMNEIEQKAFKSRYIIANSLAFKDEVINNRDLRVLKTVSGKTLMYYTFINDKFLLIAKDFETLDEIAKRLATSQFKQ